MFLNWFLCFANYLLRHGKIVKMLRHLNKYKLYNNENAFFILIRKQFRMIIYLNSLLLRQVLENIIFGNYATNM